MELILVFLVAFIALGGPIVFRFLRLAIRRIRQAAKTSIRSTGRREGLIGRGVEGQDERADSGSAAGSSTPAGKSMTGATDVRKAEQTSSFDAAARGASAPTTKVRGAADTERERYPSEARREYTPLFEESTSMSNDTKATSVRGSAWSIPATSRQNIVSKRSARSRINALPPLQRALIWSEILGPPASERRH